jgi:uncharacterized protein
MTITHDITNLSSLIDDYIAVWNEPDAYVREGLVHRLWAQDAVEYTANVYRGHDELVPRVTAAYEEFVKGAGMLFRCADDAVGHHGLVRFTVAMGPAVGGPDIWTGFVVLALDDAGRIHREHQFANPPAPATSATTPQR